MGNISYPQFGKVKTIVLPITQRMYENDYSTLEDYKKDTGIDLKDIIMLTGSEILFKPEMKNCVFLTNAQERYDTPLIQPAAYFSQAYSSGNDDAVLGLYVEHLEGETFGIAFTIDKGLSFTIENLNITLFSAVNIA